MAGEPGDAPNLPLDLVNQAVAEVLGRLASALPGGLGDRLAGDARTLKELLMEARPPKLLIVGRRGAGKSSLVNAILGENVAAVGSVLAQTGPLQWYSHTTARGELRLLDTRGLGEASRTASDELLGSRGAIGEIEAALEREAPDSLLFLCKAKEVDARIGEDVDNVVEIRRLVKRRHAYELPVVAVVTQVDELDPKRIEPPYDDPEKQRNIAIAVTALAGALAQRGIGSTRVLPVSAYAEIRDGRRVYDNYWNVDLLVEYLIEGLPQSAQLQLARLTRQRAVQERLARRLTGAAATLSAGIGAAPIPIADIVPITGLQIGLITAIAYLSGRDASRETAREFLVALGANVGAAFALREAARALVKIVFPGGGSAVSGGVAFAGTWSVGEAATAYFIQGRSIREAKRLLVRGRRRQATSTSAS